MVQRGRSTVGGNTMVITKRGFGLFTVPVNFYVVIGKRGDVLETETRSFRGVNAGFVVVFEGSLLYLVQLYVVC